MRTFRRLTGGRLTGGRLAGDRAGVAAVEFAMVAPVALVMLFSLIEVGRAYWVKQTLNEVAYATARCMSVASSCDTEDDRKDYAVSRARSYAIIVQSSDVVVTSGTTCRGEADSNMVSVTNQFDSPAQGLLPFLPSQISATACFPV